MTQQIQQVQQCFDSSKGALNACRTLAKSAAIQSGNLGLANNNAFQLLNKYFSCNPAGVVTPTTTQQGNLGRQIKNALDATVRNGLNACRQQCHPVRNQQGQGGKQNLRICTQAQNKYVLTHHSEEMIIFAITVAVPHINNRVLQRQQLQINNCVLVCLQRELFRMLHVNYITISILSEHPHVN
jgi:hypothetical protein